MSTCAICGSNTNLTIGKRVNSATMTSGTGEFTIDCTFDELTLCYHDAAIIGIYSQSIISDCIAYNGISWGSVQWFNNSYTPNNNTPSITSTQPPQGIGSSDPRFRSTFKK
jgi:hypothetical protein